MDHQLDICAGARDQNADKLKLADYKVNVVSFDFMDQSMYKTALSGCEVIFLLRPPQISDVVKYFKPLIDICKSEGLKHIVFLSVQGVEKSSIIPHHKIEKLIIDSKIPYTFLRPAYFMQNFTTTLRSDLTQKRQIFLPAGNAKFTIVDVCDIGAVAAVTLTTISLHKNKSYDLTNNEKLTFAEMAKVLSNHLGIEIKFTSPNLLHFFLTKRREKVPMMLILVMIMLHYFPRFQEEPTITDWVEKITHRPATTFDEFITRNKKLLKV